MAIQEQIDILQRGIKVWNTWRTLLQEVSIDLTKINLSQKNLSGANFNDAKLTDANLTNANLTGADLTDANLTDADLTNANLTGADLTGADLFLAKLTDANFANAHLTGANLASANLTNANLTGADLTDAKLKGADLTDAKLKGAYLARADLTDADLTDADFTNALLTGTDLTNADPIRANFTNAHLTGANLARANLTNANLTGANLTGANLTSANLTSANFARADLKDTNLTNANFSGLIVGWTTFGNLDLRTTKGLETIHTIGPSYISTSTLERSNGEISTIFLKNVGVSNNLIDYAHSLFNNPIEYYTCFISYSSKDQDFAEQLYANLQSKGVLCWFAPHHLKTGDEFRTRIDESIRLYDKLLLILSQHSVKSEWVKKEVETAFTKENKQKKLVLFPIKLDEAVIRTRQAWAADIRNMRHITDFTGWKDHDIYKKTLEKLLNDLQASEIKKRP